ncbi:sensor histidine kinase [Labilibacter marinus]|uniref:sensor histidine kinase n=1 Tax=Labilibacter marinus TaxID=1477105 RepID=UPI00082BDF63|nr:PAS domain-containing protein [Labilibacter marinus]
MRISLLLILVLFISCLKLGAKDIKEILLLNSYHTGYQWTDDLTKGVLDGIGPHDKTRVFVEYMDYKRFQNKGFFYELENLYKYKYQDLDLDGIILADNYAFEFFMDKGDSIWNTDIPVTACGVNDIQKYDYDTLRIKAIKEEIDVDNTIKSIFKLNPQTDSLILISDQTLSGKIFLSEFLFHYQHLHINVPYIIMDGSNYENIRDQIKKIKPQNKAIVLLSLYSNKYDVPVEMKDIGKELLGDLEIPIYSFWFFLMDNLITGGSLISSYDQGFDAAKVLAQRMNDPNVLIPSLQSSKHHLHFDYNLIQKHQLNEKALPEFATFENKQIPFYVRFKKQLIYFLTTLIVLIVIILFLMTNIILRKKTELKLIESEKRLELALNGANEGLWDIHFKRKEIIYNNNLATLLGYENADELDISFCNWRGLFRPQDLLQFKETFILHLQDRSPIFKLETQLYTKSGDLNYYLINGKITERDANEMPIRVTGVIMDISAQKEFETQLKIAKEKAEESDRLKSSFLANMSHEIRTPMNAILGFSDILLCQELNKVEKETYLSQIKNSGENLLHIINDIVDISKIESGQLMIRKEKVDLNKLLSNIEYAGNTLIKARKKSISFIVQKAENGEQFIYSDPFRLEQIFLNLISNAVKFTHKGSINVNFTNHNNSFVFHVTDTGEGISEEDQQIIFERFRQAESSTKKLLSGTGLGLSITQSLIHLLDGDISVKSKLEEGSEFTFNIPSKSVY